MTDQSRDQMFAEMDLSAVATSRASGKARNLKLQSAARHAKEQLMNKHRPTTALCCFLLLAASAGSSAAQQSPSDVHAGMQCGGQYECIEDRPLTEAEARTSHSHPQFAHPQEAAQVQPTASSSVEQRKVSSAR
jgi:hypothetical protein